MAAAKRLRGAFHLTSIHNPSTTMFQFIFNGGLLRDVVSYRDKTKYSRSVRSAGCFAWKLDQVRFTFQAYHGRRSWRFTHM